MNDIINTVQGNSGNLSAQSAALSGMLPGMQQQIANTGKQLQPGIGYLDNVLGGKYLGQANPYMNQMIGQTANDVGNRVNSTFSLAGRSASGDNKIQLAEGLGNAENQLRYGDYQNERNQMTQAAGMLPALTSAQYAGYAPYFQASQLAGQMPYYGVNALSGLGGMAGGYGTQSGTQPGGWGNALLGAAASVGSAAAVSDRRLKTNIEKIGEAKDGLGLYEWNWKADPHGEKVQGVIADEVERLRPWAFVPNFRGEFAGVNYANLGSLA